MLDGIVMEKLGIPTAVVCTEPFVSSGKAMAVAHGFPDYPFVVMPHPINATNYETLDSWVEDILTEIVRLLSP
ncbi:MAG: hypothetical protein LJE96_00025 [Deltaproteobacteria bacterium]|nr:hypothetical protein [Deltaproteobacteria bacterium]